MNQKKLNLVFLIVSAVFAVLAIILIVVGILYNTEHLFTKIMIFVVAALSLALAGELFYLRYISIDRKPNYFLYDSKKRKNINVQDLTFAMVNNKMSRYFAGYASSEGKIWTDGILDDEALDMADEFKPIVSYKLLFDLAHMDIESGWKCFELASVQTVDFICNGLEQNGDDEIANNLRLMKTAIPFQIKFVREYIVSNKKYLQGRMFRYVIDNIEKFQ